MDKAIDLSEMTKTIRAQQAQIDALSNKKRGGLASKQATDVIDTATSSSSSSSSNSDDDKAQIFVVIEEYERRKNPKQSDIRLFRGAIINKEERDSKDIQERKLRIKASKKVIDSDTEDEDED